MVKIQEEFLNNDDIMLLSLSVTPIMDSIPVLREYADKKGVIDSKWNIMTGDKKHIYELARKSYFAVVEKGDGGFKILYIPQISYWWIKKKQIRGIYDGAEDEEILRLISDIRVLID